jgi:hypothetical protein
VSAGDVDGCLDDAPGQAGGGPAQPAGSFDAWLQQLQQGQGGPCRQPDSLGEGDLTDGSSSGSGESSEDRSYHARLEALLTELEAAEAQPAGNAGSGTQCQPAVVVGSSDGLCQQGTQQRMPDRVVVPAQQ